MKKVFVQFIIIVASFFLGWFTLSQVDWMTAFRIEKINKSTEEKLGDLYWELFDKTGKEIKSPKVKLPLDSLLNKICLSNHINPKEIKLHVIESDEINAFALPNKHLLINSALLLDVSSEAELAGVICHEIAHMEKNHVMKKLVKEVGLSVLISMATGNNGAEMIKKSVKLLSSTAYDRELEKEADLKAVDYLIQSGISPEPFTFYLLQMGDDDDAIMKHFSWINTHPDSKDRAELLTQYCKNKVKISRAVLSAESWENMKLFCTTTPGKSIQ